MNIKKALAVIDQKTEYIRKNTYNARGEDTIRVKLSDLRAVIEALGCEPIETDSQRYVRLQKEGMLNIYPYSVPLDQKKLGR